MLDKNEVIRKLNALVPNLIITLNEELKILKDCLTWLNDNNQHLEELFKIGEISWSGHINQAIELKSFKHPYQILGVDGSQIYPDRHQGVNCFLLNIGFAEFSYAEKSTVALKSFPSLYFENDVDFELSPENINYLRTGQEFIKGFEYSQNMYIGGNAEQFVFLFDGPLYFWYLDNKPGQIKKNFLSNYLSSLQLFYSKRMPIIGFLSAPKNKEIINLIKVGLSKKIINLGYECNADFQFITDADFVSLFLKSCFRTPIFSFSSSLSNQYPEPLRPSFCYINFKTEIVRIEFPNWLTKDPHFDKILNIVIDQCNKGNGYPIALSEAHEQAVVKGYDRDFFYDTLHKIALKNNLLIKFSQKSTKKKLVGV